MSIKNRDDATYTIDDVIKMFDVICDTRDLMVDTQVSNDMDDGSLNNDEMESYGELLKISIFEYDSQVNSQSDSSNTKCEF